MTVMVALVGGQSLPNLLPVRHYHPSGVLLVYTPTTKKVFERLREILQKETTVYDLETDAYDIVGIAKTLGAKLDSPELVAQPTVFNLTGATKTMSLAAYEVAQQRNAPILYMESEGKHNRVYHYAWKQNELQALSNELLSESVKLSDLFDVHLGVGNWKEHGPAHNDGGPFEAAVAEAVRSHGYEVMVGVKTMTDQIDIDVAVRFENQLGIIEAKSGENGKKLEGIKQLSTAAGHLGTYTKKFYAITVPPSPSHAALRDAANIQIISLSNYIQGTTRLSPDDAAELITIVDKIIKG